MIFLEKSQKSTAMQHRQLQQGFPGAMDWGMRSNDVTANGLADVVGLPRCPLNATRTLRMIENLIRVLMWFITDAYSSFVFFEILSANRLL